MAAYNRRWYILSFLIGLVGVGLMGASLGTESLVVMDLPRENSSETSYRNVGFFIGSDNIQISTSPSKSFPRWPVLCGGTIIFYLNITKDCKRKIFNLQSVCNGTRFLQRPKRSEGPPTLTNQGDLPKKGKQDQMRDPPRIFCDIGVILL